MRNAAREAALSVIFAQQFNTDCLDVLKSKLYSLELEKKNKEINDMKNGQMSIAFGSGKRSYVMCPYTLVKDNESGYETSSVDKVLDGELDELIKMGLREC